MVYLGIDIGGTFIKVAYKDKKIKKDKFKYDKTKESFFKTIFEIIEKFNPDKVGIAVAGLVDKKTGFITNSPNLKFIENTNLKEILEKKFNIPVYIENDANLAAYGEYIYGNGKDSKVLICLTLGTGLGGGLVVDGNIYSGVSGSAMEVGHMVVEKDGLICHCGRKGCLESYVSSYGLERLYCIESSKFLSSFDVIKLAKNGDNIAIRVFDIFTDYLSIGIMNLTHIFNPDKILLSGGIIENYPKIMDDLKLKLGSLLFPLPKRDLLIDIAKLGSWSGGYGALAYAINQSS